MNILSPTLLIDEKKCHKNIRKMKTKAKKHNIHFRPHFKTHQSAKVGEFFRQHQISRITVSSIEMANYFAKLGWQDITIAFPVNPLKVSEINQLSSKINLSLLITHEKSITMLSRQLKNNIAAYIEIDVGDHRSGIASDHYEKIETLVDQLRASKQLWFKGFLTHAGHTYEADTVSKILKIHDKTIQQMTYLSQRFPDAEISIGNTPSCSLSDNFKNINEIRPGNFIYYDLTQHRLGACAESEIAVVLAAPIVDKNDTRREFVVHAGGVHLSKEYLIEQGKKHYGRIVSIHETGWSPPLKKAFMKSLSQEHGIIKLSRDYYEQFDIGDIIGILPVHSCMTANLMKGKEMIINSN